MGCKCCSASNMSKKSKECPHCHSEAEKVQMKTVLSLLKEENQNLEESQELFYCNNHNCDLIYFSENHTFYRKDLRIDIDDKVCFCFDISTDEFKREGKDKTLDKIRSNMKNIGCSCDTKNPSGKCCTIQIKSDY